jgi:hypothetical protein
MAVARLNFGGGSKAIFVNKMPRNPIILLDSDERNLLKEAA